MLSDPTKTRREFLSTAARAAAGVTLGSLAGCFPEVGGLWPYVGEQCRDLQPPDQPIAGASRVTEVLCAGSVTGDPPLVQSDQVASMVNAALASLAGRADYWTALLADYTPGMRIGLKVNCLNRACATQVPVVRALVESLKAQLGATADQIVVWDRRMDELVGCGFSSSAVGASVMGTVLSTTDASGPGYSAAYCGVVEGKAPRLSRILTDLTDVTINVPVLKTHGVSGVTGALKNIYGVIDIPSDYHANLNTAMPALFRLPPIRTRMRLTVLDALIAVTNGGTSDPPDAVPRRVLAAVDPLAIDSRARALVDELRADAGDSPVDEKVLGWLRKGYELGLGTLEHELVRVAL
jgi:uncharacterized protein (DUF362 family)